MTTLNSTRSHFLLLWLALIAVASTRSGNELQVRGWQSTESTPLAARSLRKEKRNLGIYRQSPMSRTELKEWRQQENGAIESMKSKMGGLQEPHSVKKGATQGLAAKERAKSAEHTLKNASPASIISNLNLAIKIEFVNSKSNGQRGLTFHSPKELGSMVHKQIQAYGLTNLLRPGIGSMKKWLVEEQLNKLASPAQMKEAVTSRDAKTNGYFARAVLELYVSGVRPDLHIGEPIAVAAMGAKQHEEFLSKSVNWAKYEPYVFVHRPTNNKWQQMDRERENVHHEVFRKAHSAP